MIVTISDKQEEMLAFIENFVTKNGYPPTHEEIRVGLNISSKSLVNYHLEALENADLLARAPNTPRGIRLTNNKKAAQTSFDTVTESTPTDVPPLDTEDVLELTFDFVTNNNRLYAIKVEDDTLADAFVNCGDVVILQSQSCARNGELVAVLLPENDQTLLKHYYRENGHVRLQSANSNVLPTIVKPEAVKIQGKVVAVIRQTD